MTMNNQARRSQKTEKSQHERCRPVANHDVVNSCSDVEAGQIHGLRDSIRRLLNDNEELCDLCCFLDDDRQRYRRDAVEWQKLHQQMATEITKKVFPFLSLTAHYSHVYTCVVRHVTANAVPLSKVVRLRLRYAFAVPCFTAM